MRELKRLGLRFKLNAKNLPGKPDIVFPEKKLAVFCDGDFWHGRNWRSLSRKLGRGTNKVYWEAKIASNIERDREVNGMFKVLGWRVVRIWETDIKKHHKDIADRLFETVRGKDGNCH